MTVEEMLKEKGSKHFEEMFDDNLEYDDIAALYVTAKHFQEESDRLRMITHQLYHQIKTTSDEHVLKIKEKNSHIKLLKTITFVCLLSMIGMFVAVCMWTIHVSNGSKTKLPEVVYIDTERRLHAMRCKDLKEYSSIIRMIEVDSLTKFDFDDYCATCVSDEQIRVFDRK